MTEFNNVTKAVSTETWSRSTLESICLELDTRKVPFQLRPGEILVEEKFVEFLGKLAGEEKAKRDPSAGNSASLSSYLRKLAEKVDSQSGFDLGELSRRMKRLISDHRRTVTALVLILLLLGIIRSMSGTSEKFDATITNCVVDAWDGDNQNVACDVTGVNNTAKPEHIYIGYEITDSQGFKVDGSGEIGITVPAKGSKTEPGVYMGWFVTNGTYGVEPPYKIKVTGVRMLDTRDD